MSGSIAVAVLGGAVAAFVFSGLYYTLFERRLSDVQQVGTLEESSPWVYAVEFVRSLVISTVLAGIAYFAGVRPGSVAWSSRQRYGPAFPRCCGWGR